MTADELAAACTELEQFFTDVARARTAATRAGGEQRWREFVAAHYIDSAAFFFNGSHRKPVRYSTDELATPATASDTTPDPRYEWRYVSMAVGLASEREALYLARFADLSSDYFEPSGRARPYIAVQAGTVVRTEAGWRILRTLDMSDRTGLGPSALVASSSPWECR